MFKHFFTHARRTQPNGEPTQAAQPTQTARTRRHLRVEPMPRIRTYR
jgi:hypothetical protein